MGSVIDALTRLGSEADELATEAVVEALSEHLKQTLSASSDPYGNSWPAKANGENPLKNVYSAVLFERIGTSARASIFPPEVYHHYGAGGSVDNKAAKSAMNLRKRRRKAGEVGTNKFHAPRRAIIPDDRGMPDALARKIENLFAKKVNG